MKILTKSIRSIPILLLLSCSNRIEKKLVNTELDIWHVIQHGSVRRDSSLRYYRFNKNNSYDEIYFFDNKFKIISSNPDVKNYHKWAIVNDSLITISFLDYKILLLNDSLVNFVSIKRPTDSLFLKKVPFARF
ncbi:MAG: hypothetical protein BGO54_11635 [Sphingobacteriales bacterium 46-32]|nr:MAG: hypothetical protein BGO54_11635 [Sphingobacteriales bacterium 46-32]